MDVVIIEIETGKTFKTINEEPLPMAEAEKVEAGANINLNHDLYRVEIYQS